MEFFKIINIQTTENQLQELLSLDNFNSLNESLFILDYENNSVNIGGIWGEFTLKRDQIRGGVRFALVECPNALTWTLTTGYPPAREQIVLHLTINRTQKEAEFVEELKEFLEDWEQGLLLFFKNQVPSHTNLIVGQ